MSRFALLPIAFMFIVSTGCFKEPCANEVLDEVPSPDRNLKAVVFVRNCGATTGLSTQVSVLGIDEVIENEPGNVFIIEPDGDVNAKWISASSLELEHPARTEVFRQMSEYRGTEITYLPR